VSETKRLHWERVEGVGNVAYPELVCAEVPGGWLYAATDWDVEKDAPRGWSLILVPRCDR
jgi:hypothetical protein